MSHHGMPFVPLRVMVALLLVCGCKERATVDASGAASVGSHPASEDAGIAAGDAGGGVVLDGEFTRPINERPFELGGREDVENRYPSAVAVETLDPMKAGVNGQCSGVLMGPRLVLTAGHCVCVQRSDLTPGNKGGVIVDGTACAKTATVTTVAYTPPKKGRGTSSLARSYPGSVRPHPELKILLDAQRRVVSSNADLAVIVLDEPVDSGIPSIELADTDVAAGEFIVMASYGFDEVLGGREGQRRWIRYKVMKHLAAGDGRVQYEQPGRALYKGDSGGPCLRESGGHAVLVGVSSRGLGEEPTFTSTFAYRDWLRAEIQRAAGDTP
jgi:hypothetical protein